MINKIEESEIVIRHEVKVNHNLYTDVASGNATITLRLKKGRGISVKYTCTPKVETDGSFHGNDNIRLLGELLDIAEVLAGKYTSKFSVGIVDSAVKTLNTTTETG